MRGLRWDLEHTQSHQLMEAVGGWGGSNSSRDDGVGDQRVNGITRTLLRPV